MIYQGSDPEMFLNSQILKNAFNDSTIFNDLKCSYSLKALAKVSLFCI